MHYLDLGCHDGRTIVEFYEGKFGGIPPENIKCIAFDPLPDYMSQWESLKNLYSVVFHQKVVSDFDGKVILSIQVGNDMGSSIMKDKNSFAGGNMVEVDAVDLSKFIAALDGEVVIRMDIEGAEYPVLAKMIADGTIDRVAYMEVEWHAKKMTPQWLNKEAEIVAELHRRGIDFKSIQ